MKATHKGECQICGSTQMLPNGKLSQHGYTVQCGFFNGVCAGAFHLPFEQSKDQIAPVVAQVEVTIKAVAKEIAQYRDKNSELNSTSKAWVHEYLRYGGYVWTQVELRVTRNQNPGSDYVYFTCAYNGSDTANKFANRVESPIGSKCETIQDFVHVANCKYADHLARINSSRRDWVKWQQGRLANWTVKPLKEREGKAVQS